MLSVHAKINNHIHGERHHLSALQIMIDTILVVHQGHGAEQDRLHDEYYLSSTL